MDYFWANLFGCIAIYMYINLGFLGCVIPFALWKIFKKAGEKGWKSIIPIYDMVVANKIIGISPWLALLSLVSFIALFPNYGHITLGWLKTGGYLVLAFMDFYVNYKLSKSFGHKWPFALGLIFVSFLFYPILAFGESQYIGPKSKEVVNKLDKI